MYPNMLCVGSLGEKHQFSINKCQSFDYWSLWSMFQRLIENLQQSAVINFQQDLKSRFWTSTSRFDIRRESQKYSVMYLDRDQSYDSRSSLFFSTHKSSWSRVWASSLVNAAYWNKPNIDKNIWSSIYYYYYFQWRNKTYYLTPLNFANTFELN